MTDERASEELAAKVPPLPSPVGGYGYDWMDKITEANCGWWPEPVWGSRGWVLGNWPLVIICLYDSDGVHAVAEYIEGDITVHAFATREQRDAKTDELAVAWWRQDATGPKDLPERFEDVPQEYRGPYRYDAV